VHAGLPYPHLFLFLNGAVAEAKAENVTPKLPTIQRSGREADGMAGRAPHGAPVPPYRVIGITLQTKLTPTQRYSNALGDELYGAGGVNPPCTGGHEATAQCETKARPTAFVRQDQTKQKKSKCALAATPKTPQPPRARPRNGSEGIENEASGLAVPACCNGHDITYNLCHAIQRGLPRREETKITD